MTKNHANRGRAVEMKKIFETFDLDRSGKISAEELRESMAKLGESLSTPQGLFFYISCLLKILFCCDLNDEVRLKPRHLHLHPWTFILLILLQISFKFEKDGTT